MSTDGGGTRRPYPDGPKHQMTTVWKESVKAKLALLGKNKVWLAKEVGVDKAAITRMLSAEQNTSSMVPRVSEVLEIPPPMVDVDSSDDIDTLDQLRQLEPDDKEYVKKMIERLLRNPDAKP